jgi:hypothetical protein
MRDIGQFVGRNHAVDNGRPVGLERLVDGIAQLARLFGLEAHAAAGARQSRIIRIGEVDGLFPGRHPDRFGLQDDQSEGRIGLALCMMVWSTSRHVRPDPICPTPFAPIPFAKVRDAKP